MIFFREEKVIYKENIMIQTNLVIELKLSKTGITRETLVKNE